MIYLFDKFTFLDRNNGVVWKNIVIDLELEKLYTRLKNR